MCVRVRLWCVRWAQAIFEGEVDASTVKHRLDVLNELRLPVFITDFSISNLDPAKHAYELEKVRRSRARAAPINAAHMCMSDTPPRGR
jgi:hypothetical protein